MRNSKKLGFPFSVVLDEGRPIVRNSLVRLGAGCLFFLRWSYLGSLVVCLLEVVRKKKVTAGGLDGWGWRELRSCLFLGMMGWPVFLLQLRILA